MRKAVVLILCLTIFAGAAAAGTDAGSKEIQVQGSLTRSTNSENDDQDYTLTGVLVANYFLVPQFSFGTALLLSGSVAIPESGDETRMVVTFIQLRADLYLTGGASSVVPYIGAQGGVANYMVESEGYSDTSTSLAYGAHGGFKFFTTENTSWNLEGNVNIYKPDVEDNEDDVSYTDMSLLLGFSYYF